MNTNLQTLWKRMLFSIVLTGLIIPVAKAQVKSEFGITIGPANFLGDLGGNIGRGTTFLKDNNWKATTFLPGVFFAVSPAHFVNFRVSATIGRLEGADSLIKGHGGMEEARKARNQHFRSPLMEAFVAAEFYPTSFLEADPDDLSHKFRPYFMVGAGVFRFNPQAQFIDANGQATWVDLKPLRTEGQGMSKYPNRAEYKLTQLNIPYGVGIKYYFNEKFSLGFEVVARKTFTDYMDDVSTTYIAEQDFYDHFGAGSQQAIMAIQMANKSAFASGGNFRPGYGAGDKRGTPTNNDSYYSTNLKLGIHLGDQEPGSYKGKYRNKLKCPVVRF